MTVNDLLIDAFDRVRESVHDVLDGPGKDVLRYRPDPEANTIAWLIWHLTRIQDDHIAGVAGHDQAWMAGGWSKRFGLPFNDSATGYGHGPDDVAAVDADADLLRGYYDAVHDATTRYLATISDEDLSRVVDERWDPPVTLAVRLVSVINDDTQHVGQAAYLRGLADRVG